MNGHRRTTIAVWLLQIVSTVRDLVLTTDLIEPMSVKLKAMGQKSTIV
ncbi:hypothetical protein QFZ81_004929 [Paenibacillus sp. V4I9]|nr:hypothetical protein [Paenibacillus sp. V4I9]MDQ0889841.1 hypothetical protein [Paenibacillus sp. V4I9]